MTSQFGLRSAFGRGGGRSQRQQRRQHRTSTNAFNSGGGGYGSRGGLSLGSVALGAVLGAGLGAGVSLWWLESRGVQRRPAAGPPSDDAVAGAGAGAGSRDAKDVMNHPCLKFGMPVGSVLRPFTNFVSFFDTRTRNPHWVIERISEGTSNGDGNRKFSYFKEDAAIPSKLRNKLEDFRGSGYVGSPTLPHSLPQNTFHSLGDVNRPEANQKKRPNDGKKGERNGKQRY